MVSKILLNKFEGYLTWLLTDVYVEERYPQADPQHEDGRLPVRPLRLLHERDTGECELITSHNQNLSICSNHDTVVICYSKIPALTLKLALL